MSNRSLFLPLLPTAALLWACGDSSTNNPPPPPPPPPECTVSVVTVTGAPAELEVSASVQLDANVTSTNCTTTPTVSWSTSSNTIATVSNAGLVTAVSAGPVTITATAGGKSGTAEITVVPIPIAEVEITPAVITIGTGRSHQLVATALDAGGEPIDGVEFTWSSDNASVTVDGNGVITAVTPNAGAAITATADGISAATVVSTVRPRLAYLWNDDSDATGNRTPDESYSYNSTGSANSVTHPVGADGQYSAIFLGHEREANETEAIFVSGYDLDAGGYCNQASWASTVLNIRCFSAGGNLANANWTAAHISSGSFPGRFAYGWVSSGDVSTNPSTSFRFNSSGLRTASTRLGVGEYTVSFEGLARTSSTQREAVIVNAYGSEANCQVADWNLDGSLFENEMVIRVLCFDHGGTPVNSRFTVLMIERPREGARLAFAVADQPTTAAYSPDNGAVLPTGDVTINRPEVGRYTVHFFDFYRTGDLKETFLISPMGEEPAKCHVDQWADSDTPGGQTTVWVECSDPSGTPKDVPFSLIGLQ